MSAVTDYQSEIRRLQARVSRAEAARTAQEARIRVLREAAQKLVVAAGKMQRALDSTMPGVRFIAVQDSALLSEAPLETAEAVAAMTNALHPPAATAIAEERHGDPGRG